MHRAASKEGAAMITVHLPNDERPAVIDAIGELLSIPTPGGFMATVATTEAYIADSRRDREPAFPLLSALSGITCEQEDRHDAKRELRDDAKEAIEDAKAWLSKRKAEDWK